MSAVEYTEAERRQAMAVYAFVSGREKAGVKLLSEAKLDIKWGTVRSWVTRYRDDYAQVKAEVDEHARSMMADSHRRLATLAMESEEKALEQVAELLARGEIKPRELPKLMQSLGIMAGVHTDKSELMSGHPTTRVAGDLGDIKKALDAAGIEVLIEGSAEDEDELPALPAGATP